MNETRERWKQLCAQAAVEQDITKLLSLVEEINRLLEEKHDHRTVRNVSGDDRLSVQGEAPLQ